LVVRPQEFCKIRFLESRLSDGAASFNALGRPMKNERSRKADEVTSSPNVYRNAQEAARKYSENWINMKTTLTHACRYES
jgi:hypothetical protein